MVKVKVSFDISQIKAALAEHNKLLTHNIRTVIKKDAIPDLIERIMVGFDELADRADLLPEDPTNPGNWRAEFKALLEEDLNNTFIYNGNTIEVHLGEKQFLGYDPSGETNNPRDDQPLQWMVYYLEGLAGDWAFISPDVYELHRGDDKFNTEWGRFGRGFMISKERFFKEGWNQVVSFEQVRHPFSGYAPVDIFSNAARSFRFRPFVEKAIRATTAGRKL